MKRKLLNPKRQDQPLDVSQREAALQEMKLQRGLDHNVRLLRESAGHSPDLGVRDFRMLKTAGTLLYFEGVVRSETIERILRSLQIESVKTKARKLSLESLAEELLTTEEITKENEIRAILQDMALGDVAVLIDGQTRALICNAREWTLRSVDEPEAEIVLRGPHEGFIESSRINVSLLRRRIRSPNFWLESFEIGSLTGTTIIMGYIKGLASEELVAEVRERVKSIDTDSLLDSGKLEEFISDHPYSVFPTMMRTERPDRTAAALLEGRVVLITEGTPVCLVMPAEFISFLQTPDDYNEIVPIGSFVRLLRGVAGMVALFLPGLYVAVANFHQELLPSELFLRVMATREGIPFPVLVEIFFMESIFEVLREAGVRLPRAIGAAISIVGALVLGDAAIRAGLVSPAAVIVVAFTAISSFTVPVFSIGITGRLLRFAFIILGGVFGLFGIQVGFLLIAAHMASLRSFGYPYLSPFGPLVVSDLKDAGLRWFWWDMVKRPKLVGGREPMRQAGGQKPQPPTKGQS